MARAMGFKGFDVTFSPAGGSLYMREIDDAEPIKDIIISLAGPAFNLSVAFICYVINLRYNSEILTMLVSGNISIGIFNLLPAIPLDGSRILRSIFRLKMIYKKANEYTIKVSLVLGYILLFIYLIMFFRDIHNITFGITILFIIFISMKEREKLAYLIMGDIVSKRGKFLKRGYIENMGISILSTISLLEVIALVEKNKYTMFYVLNEEMNLIGVFYENDLIDALKNYGNITVKEFLEKL